ncbi:hypothetical protein H671_2g5732 [Cricetulus griseus]|uniref:Uncharacterized protein n=1 Tax=Cricetulus griseus TaxID=10029 RepID=A0A061IIJ0_CRIGR|nr:hypothetical protein H671_2g5732 [Cricetulus griseus]
MLRIKPRASRVLLSPLPMELESALPHFVFKTQPCRNTLFRREKYRKELEKKKSYQELIGEPAIPHMTTRCQKAPAAMLRKQDACVELGSNCLKLPLKPGF